MNKDIFDEAIETLLGVGTTFIAVPCNPIGEENSDMIHLRNATKDYESEVSKVVKALVIAKKEHELLDLYKYLNENTNDYDLNFDTVDEIHNKISEIEEQIKEKENE